MELAKVTSKGQVTIPIEIRKKLGIKNGDKVLFVEEAGRIYMMNSSMDALREAQRTFAGEAERLGLKNDDDVMAMIKELREEGGVKQMRIMERYLQETSSRQQFLKRICMTCCRHKMFTKKLALAS